MAENTFLEQVKKSILSLSKRGYIVESGENANGNYIRYSDGTQICYKSIKITTTVQNSWGSLFESPLFNLGSYAKDFAFDDVKVFIQCGPTGYPTLPGVIRNISKSSFGQTVAIRPNQTQSSEYQYSLFAIGKWK